MGDFNGDGHADLPFRNKLNGNIIRFMNGVTFGKQYTDHASVIQ